MLPSAQLVHNSYGRARFRIPSLRLRTPELSRLTKRLSECDAVESVQANPNTASVVLLYRGNFETVAQYAVEKGLFRVVTPAEEPSPFTSANLQKTVKKIDRGFRNLTGGRTDATALTFISFVSVGVVQLARGRIFPPGISLITQAFSILGRHKPTEPTGA